MSSRRRSTISPASPAGPFSTGDLVEVRSDEEGFKGSWFEARIVRSMPKLRRYTVEYQTLVSEADASRLLRETLDAVNVRPRPPRRTGPNGGFEVGQTVDAYWNDGWWAGVVSRVSGEGEERRFTVFFPVSKEDLECPASDLRLQLEWVDGEWIQAQSQNLSNVEFRKGSLVEVSSDDEGFRGAWYTATVVEKIGNKFLVEYENLRTDDESKPLTETVDSLHIRPRPPMSPVVGKFILLEEVDAIFNDGWWVGIISKVLEGSRYMVYFKTTKEELEFEHKDLRLHHDWSSGRWLRTSPGLWP